MSVPGHVGIRGNEAADRAVKDALDKKPTADLMPLLDLKPDTAKYVYQIWQKEWDETVLVYSKFRVILLRLPDKLLPFCYTKKEDTLKKKKEKKRLHIGYSEAPVCVACNDVIAQLNISELNADLLEIRKKFFEERVLYSLFWNEIPFLILINFCVF